MADPFGPRWSAGAVAAPLVAALLAGSAAYAFQQDAFGSRWSAGDAAAAQPGKDKALAALKDAVAKQQKQLDRMRADLKKTEKATRQTLAAARSAAAGAGSSWVPSSSGGTSGWSGSGSSSGGSGGGTSSGGSGGSGGSGVSQPAPQPTVQATTGASGG